MYLKIIQQEWRSGILCFLIFMISVFIANRYQCQRISYDMNGYRKMNYMPKTKQFLWILLIIAGPVIMIGLRRYDVGVDTLNLTRSFLDVGNQKSFIAGLTNLNDSRVIYYFFQYLIYSMLGPNPNAMLFAMSFLTLFTLGCALNKWIDKISLSLSFFIYYCFFGMLLLDQSRQLWAVSVVLYGVTHLISGKTRKFFLTIIIASLIHFSALVAITFYFMKFKPTRLYRVKQLSFYMVSLISPLFMHIILNILSLIIPSKYQWYLEDITFKGGWGWLINIFPLMIVIAICRKYINDKENEYLIRIIILAYVFRLAGYYSFFLMRLYYYGAIAIILLIPAGIWKVKRKNKKYCMVMGISGVFIAYYIINFIILNANKSLPYYSVFNN